MVLVFVEHRDERPTDLSLQALAFGRQIAGLLGVPLNAAVFGSAATSVASHLAAQGVAVAHTVEDARLDVYAPGAWGRALADLVESAAPRVVVSAGTERGNEVVARLAARLDQPMAANCIEADPSDAFLVTRQRWGGSLLEEARIDGSPVLLTVAPHAVQAEDVAAPGDIEVVPSAVVVQDGDLLVRVTGVVPRDAGSVSLAEAEVVVGGGRGVGSAGGFGVLEELAALLGGAVGCSRAVTNAGWRSHEDQVGQTGTRIAPEIYIACGVSGASQHMVGCRGAKRILAINTDPDAPIVAQADYAVVADLHQVVPAISAAIRAMRGG